MTPRPPANSEESPAGPGAGNKGSRGRRQPRVSETAGSQRHLAGAERRIAQLEHQVAYLTARLDSLRRSKSWRLTRPLRAFTEAIARIRSGRKQSHGAGATRSQPAAPVPDYRTWISLYDRLDSAEARGISAAILGLTKKPLITVIAHCPDTEDRALDATLASVAGQLYPHWELLLLSGHPARKGEPRDSGRHTIDSRIRFLPPVGDRGRTREINEAVRSARGDFVAFLEPGDVLAERALFAVARALDENPDTAVVYADEDELDAGGQRTAPFFKPDWSPDFFHAHDFLTGLVVYRTSLLADAGGLDVSLSSGAEYDLKLRLVELLDANQILHLPMILCHRRQSPPGPSEASPDDTEAAEARVLQAHLDRLDAGARVLIDRPRRSRSVTYTCGTSPPLVSVIVPTRDRVDLLRQCVGGLLAGTDYPALELLVVDNQSREAETLEFFAEIESDPRVRILRYERQFNFSALNNYAVSCAAGEIVALVNCDIEFTRRDWLSIIAGHAQRPEIGAVGPLLLYPSGEIQSAGVVLGIGGVAANRLRGRRAADPFYDRLPLAMRNLSAVSGAFLTVRKAAFEEVGGLDEALAVAFNDVDFCLKLWERGYRNLWISQAEAIHHESQLLKRHDRPNRAMEFAREAALMQSRWGHILVADPYYNRNLSLEASRDYELASPPRPAHWST